MKEDDFIDTLLVASSHDTLLCFSTLGKLYWIKVYQIPVASRASRGRPIVNLLPLSENERITTVLPIRDYPEDRYVFMATADGTVKKTPLVEFSRPRSLGIRAIDLDESDTLVGAALTDGNGEVMLFSSGGKAIRFQEEQVRPMGRTARGVRGIRLNADQRVISLIVPDTNGQLLMASINGYGKRSPIAEFPPHGRGGQGVIAMQLSERNGALVSVIQVTSEDHIMLISDQGTLVRTRCDETPLLSRNTQGVRLIKLSEGEHLVGVERIAEDEDEDDLSEDETAQ